MIDYELNDAVARITLNAPETANRFTYAMMNDYIAALEDAKAKKALVMVIAANGDDFTRGRDQKEQLPPEISRKDSLSLILKANAALRAFPGVSISVIQGRCMGFGTGLALHTDIAVAGEHAIFGFDEILHGLAPLVVVAYLQHFVGPRLAGELILTGRDVHAKEAREIGLVNRVVPHSELHATGEHLIAQLKSHHPGAIRLIQSFSKRVNAFPDPDHGREGVDQLAAWIAAGKPE